MARFFADPFAGLVNLVTAGGFWTDIPDQKFVHYNGYTYFGWVDGATGDLKAASWRASTGVVSSPVTLHSGFAADLHNSPALLVRSSDHKLMAAYCDHEGAAFYIRISTTSLATDPTLADGFAAEVDIDSSVTGTAYTYPSLVELTDEGAIYAWFRDRLTTDLYRQSYTKSMDNGATWSAEVKVWVGDNTATHLNYRRLATNGTDRMDLFATDNDRSLATPSSLYHLYYTGGAWFRSDGTNTGLTAGMFPSDATLIKDDSDGPASACGVTYDSDGNPVVNLMTYDATSAVVWQSRWTGATWSATQIAYQNGLGTGSNPFILGAGLDLNDPNRVYLPIKVGSKFEMHLAQSPDDGITWSTTALTRNSSVDHFLPSGVWNRDDALRAIWIAGTFTDNTHFTGAVQGGY